MNYKFLDKPEYKNIKMNLMESFCCDGLPVSILRLEKFSSLIHRHDYLQIVFVSKGKLFHCLNGNTFEIVRGDIFVIPPFVPHYFLPNNNEKFECIELEFSPEYINEKFSLNYDNSNFVDFAYLEPFLVSENDMRPCMNLKGDILIKVVDMLEEMLSEFSFRKDGYDLVIKGLLLKFLALLGREYKTNPSNADNLITLHYHKSSINDAVTYINENFCNDITLSDAVKASKMSRSYFVYFFKQITNKTFIEYLNDLRINKAIKLISENSEEKILDISHKCGFNNVNHFIRVFRSITNCSPSSLRKS